MRRRKLKLSLVATAAVCWLTLGCLVPEPVDPESLTVGLLLPFTGADSATARNFERAALLARDQVNDGGGVNGHALRILSADTHSNPEEAEESVRRLIGSGAKIIIGPESTEIAERIRPLIEESGALFLSPVVGAADDRNISCEIPWFRLSPSSWILGESLAKLAFTDEQESMVLLHSEGDYDEALAAAFKERFTALGGKVLYEATLPSSAQSYARIIKEALAENAEGMLLSASPRSAALLVNELGVLSKKRPNWYLSPLLKTELLLENVEPSVLEGAVGVTPKIFDTTGEYPEAFAERWEGDQAFDGAFFYHDAVSLSAFALEHAEEVDGEISGDAISASFFEVATPSGEAVRWNEVAEAMPRLSEGDPLYYSGLTGPLLLRDCGNRKSGVTSVWYIEDGQIVE